MNSSQTPKPRKSEFIDSLQKGFILGAAVLALVLPSGGLHRKAPTPASVAQRAEPVRLADFGGVVPTPDVRHVANWSVFTRDHHDKSFIILDKKDAKVYVFDPAGRLTAASPVLLGSAVGDDTVPGIGERPIAQVRPQERTTPAGRFVAEPGISASRGEDVVWVDYDAAVSMHRIITTNPDERRAERMASPRPEDHRISYGCINLPREFYENVVSPTVRNTGAVVYVLPETRTPQEVFGSFDVEARVNVARNS